MRLIGVSKDQNVYGNVEDLTKTRQFDIGNEAFSTFYPLYGVFIYVQTEKLTFFR